MKKTLLFAASAIFALASCTTSDEVFTGIDLEAQAQADNAIQFGMYLGQTPSTRAGQVGTYTTNFLKGFDEAGKNYTETKAKAQGFGVFAYYTGTVSYSDFQYKTTWQNKEANFMFNQQVYAKKGSYTDYVGTFQDSEATPNNYIWFYEPSKYWPNDVKEGDVDKQEPAAQGDGTKGGKLSFFAYAPYVDFESTNPQSIPNNKTSGIVAINDSQTTNAAANAVTGDPVLTYILPTDGHAVDLLWGTKGETSINVLGDVQNGATGTTAGSTSDPIRPTSGTYVDNILKGYTTNADLTKQKTNGQVAFAFKHALAKVGGYSATTDAGLTAILDIDNGKGAVTGGSKQDADLVTIKSIKIDARSLTNTGTPTYLSSGQGDFNLATGRWNITGTTTTTQASAAKNEYNITVSGDDGKLNAALAENTITYSSGWLANGAAIAGVLSSTATNVFAEEEAYPLVFIPGTYPELTITVDYLVRTYDSKLPEAKPYSEVEQVITKKVTFTDAVELNKRYNLKMHIGLTSVKFTATVDGWDDNKNASSVLIIDDVHVPKNVQ